MAARRQNQLLRTGARVPDFRLARLDGGEISLDEILAAAPALLAIFKISCPVCQMTLPFLDRIHTPGRLAVYAVSQNGAGDTRDFNKHFQVVLPTLLDREENGFPVSNAFGISTVPTMFLIERDGTASRVIEGWMKQEIETLAKHAGVAPFRQDENVPAWRAG